MSIIFKNIYPRFLLLKNHFILVCQKYSRLKSRACHNSRNDTNFYITINFFSIEKLHWWNLQQNTRDLSKLNIWFPWSFGITNRSLKRHIALRPSVHIKKICVKFKIIFCRCIDSARISELNGISHKVLLLKNHFILVCQKYYSTEKSGPKCHILTLGMMGSNFYITINFFSIEKLHWWNLQQNREICLNFQKIYGFHGLSA